MRVLERGAMDSFSGLLSNSALMLMLCVLYDTFNVHAISPKQLRDGITGVVAGGIAIAVMLSPWSIEPGVFFDTRWVLLSLCGLFFGMTPTLIAVIIAGAFRLYQGGAGGVVGTIVIVSTACVGLGWRYWQNRYYKPLGWRQLYLFGFLVQLVMLSCMFLMPAGMRIPIIKAVAPPILIIYPPLTMILGLILKRQEQRRETDRALIKEMHERKAAEQAAKKSKEEWENTFNSTSDIVTLQDKEFRIVKINEAGRKTMGGQTGDIIGRHCYELFKGEDKPCPECPVAEAARTLKPCAREIVNEKLGRVFLVSGAPVLDEKGNLTHLTHVAKDITEKKKLGEELFQARKIESIGTLAGGIAHDFNNILSAIMGYAELAKVKVPPGNKAAADLDQILVSSRRAADLVKRILTFSRKTDHYLEPLSPDHVVRESLKMLRASLPVTIQFREEIESDCGIIMGDPTNIQQIVINLCTNALHAMKNEKGVLSIGLHGETLSREQVSVQKGESPGRFVVLTVKDTGRGMDPITMASIFEPYFTTKEVGKGTGLGLSVIHGIVKDSHGFIRVKSRPGQGSTFRVYLPVMHHGTLEQTQPADQEGILPAGKERLLIVDDEVQLLDISKMIFERQGYKVTAITRSLDALETVRKSPDRFDLVITDQTMPDLTGVELAGEILKIRPDMPIIICTGYSAVLSEEDALAMGARKFVKKPVGTNEMARIVRQVLDGGKRG